jgi:cytochrome c
MPRLREDRLGRKHHWDAWKWAGDFGLRRCGSELGRTRLWPSAASRRRFLSLLGKQQIGFGNKTGRAPILPSCSGKHGAFRSSNDPRDNCARHIMDGTFDRDERVHARTGGCNRAAVMMALAAMLTVQHTAPSFASGDAAHGAKVYQDCMICHSLDKNEIGPKHRGVFGSKAGSVPGYDYSAALKASNIVWNETTLDKWLTEPQAFVPGTKMTFSVDDAQDRADVIAFLKQKAAGERSSAPAGAK